VPALAISLLSASGTPWAITGIVVAGFVSAPTEGRHTLVSVYVNDEGMAGVAGQLAAQAQCLAALAASPPVHSALAVDEVSTSASARLTEHGSRASQCNGAEGRVLGVE
jgi:hypothetical protein